MPEEEVQKPESISYDKLYRRWEENPWSATGIDFSVDREHWQSKLNDVQREAALWNYALFLVGEEAVARTLTPVLDAAPEHAQKLFLTTQIVDEARHTVFFDRFMRAKAPTRSRPSTRWSGTSPGVSSRSSESLIGSPMRYARSRRIVPCWRNPSRCTT
jgi:ribonucleotide reductase beta subunit family protein with ferritin-like domain